MVICKDEVDTCFVGVFELQFKEKYIWVGLFCQKCAPGLYVRNYETKIMVLRDMKTVMLKKPF